MQIPIRAITTVIITFLITSCGPAPQAKSGGPAFPAVPVTIGQAAEESVPIQVQAGQFAFYELSGLSGSFRQPYVTPPNRYDFLSL